MLYVEIEQHINDDGTEIDMGEEKMSLLIPGHLQNREADFKEDAPEAMVRLACTGSPISCAVPAPLSDL